MNVAHGLLFNGYKTNTVISHFRYNDDWSQATVQVHQKERSPFLQLSYYLKRYVLHSSIEALRFTYYHSSTAY